MECNPRLQVEHTVTESITNLDLVECQFKIAEGATLEDIGVGQPPPSKGFAVQTRVLAERMDGVTKQISPSCEEIVEFNPPSGHGIRVETIMTPGSRTHPNYDSLIAKVIASAPTLESALRKADFALNGFTIEGPRTNVPLLRTLLKRPEVKAAAATTTFVDENIEELSPAQALAVDDIYEIEEAGVATITSPVTGTLLELNVKVGDVVSAGQPLAVLESMKMEIPIHSTGKKEKGKWFFLPAPPPPPPPNSNINTFTSNFMRLATLVAATLVAAKGEVVDIFASVNDVLTENSVVVTIRGEHEETSDDFQDLIMNDGDLNELRPDLISLNARKEKLLDENRPKAVERRRDRNQITARESIQLLCDENSFREYGGLAVAASRSTRKLADLEESTPADGVVTGVGRVNDTECVIIAVDATVIAGTQGFFHHAKLDRAVEIAKKQSLPIIVLPEGGGGRPMDTDVPNLMSAGLNLGTWTAYSALSGAVPRVSVVSGKCFAGSAAIAGASDVVITTRASTIGMGGPAMIEGGGLGVGVLAEEVGPAPELALCGAVDVVADDDEQAIMLAKKYLSFFTTKIDSPPSTSEDQRIIRQIIPENRKRAYDVRRLIKILCDKDSTLELRPSFGGAVMTTLARIEGMSVGIVASNPSSNGGAIDSNACDKISRFFRLMKAFDLPVVSLVDCPGFMVGNAAEKTGLLRKAGRLFLAGAALEDSLFAVITRKAVGLGAMALCGGSTKNAVDCVSWPTGEIGAMGVEGAVRLGFKKELDALQGEDREKLFQTLCSAVYKQNSATNAASKLEIDDVIDPAESRSRLALHLKAYYDKQEGGTHSNGNAKTSTTDLCW